MQKGESQYAIHNTATQGRIHNRQDAARYTLFIIGYWGDFVLALTGEV